MKTVIKVVTIFAGIILGGYLGELALTIPAISFLGMGKQIGITEPLVLDFNVIKLTFGFMCNLNIAAILGFIVSLFVVKKAL